MDVDDWCWRPNVLMTSFRCWSGHQYQFSGILLCWCPIDLPPTCIKLSPTFFFVVHVSKWPIPISHQHWVTNITMSLTSLSPIILLCNNIFDFMFRLNLYLNFSSVWIMFNLEIIFQHPIFLFHIFSLEWSWSFSLSFMIETHRSWKMTIKSHCMPFNQFNEITVWPTLYWQIDFYIIVWKKRYMKNWLSPGPKNQLDLPRR